MSAWFRELAKFDNDCGVLCYHLKFKNALVSDHKTVRALYKRVVQLLYLDTLAALTCHAPPHMPRPYTMTEDQRSQQDRYSQSRKELKRRFRKWRIEMVDKVGSYKKRCN